MAVNSKAQVAGKPVAPGEFYSGAVHLESPGTFGPERDREARLDRCASMDSGSEFLGVTAATQQQHFTGKILKVLRRSEALLSSPLLQAATHPHGHHLCVAVVELHDEGMILERGKKKRGREEADDTFCTKLSPLSQNSSLVYD